MSKDDVFARRDAEQAPYLEKFHHWRRFVSFSSNKMRVPLFNRVRDACSDVRQWRYVSNSLGDDYEQEIVAILVTADTLAAQIEANAPTTADPVTIAWVTAGLRCKAQPFCTGCKACQTVTSPLRPNAEIPRGPFG
jgi:hypothetical protein